MSCSTEISDGSIAISHSGASSFSIDGGATSQLANTFSNLTVGNYNILIRNDFAGCTTSEQIALINTLNAAPSVPEFWILGPSTICAGSKAIGYELNEPLNGAVTWSFDGDNSSIVQNGISSSIDFGNDATSGTLTAEMANACSSQTATLQINTATPFLCMNYSNCIPALTVTNSILENANIAHVFQAGDRLTSDAQLTTHNYEFTAGNTLQFDSGFSVDEGLLFIADVRACGN